MAHSFTTLVNIDAEATTKVVDFIGSMLGASREHFVKDCSALLEKEQSEGLMEKFLEATSLILDLETDAGNELRIQC